MRNPHLTDLLFPSEAARLVGVSAQTIRDLFDRQRLDGKRGPGGFRMIRRSSLERLIEERESRAPK